MSFVPDMSLAMSVFGISDVNKPGRRASVSENAAKFRSLGSSDRKFEFRASQKDPETVLQIREASALLKVDMSDFAREAVKAAYDRVKAGQPIGGGLDYSMIGTNQFRAKFLAKAPCGDWKEAVDLASSFVLSQDTADFLEARETDVVVMADGESMDGAGIEDGSLLLMRPLANHARPTRGEITLVQIIDEDGDCESTIKRCHRWGNAPNEIVLHDGEGNPFPLPPNTREVKAVAVSRGLITRMKERS
jgi:hypothetical protein